MGVIFVPLSPIFSRVLISVNRELNFVSVCLVSQDFILHFLRSYILFQFWGICEICALNTEDINFFSISEKSNCVCVVKGIIFLLAITGVFP